jgi:hypothetical protein
VKAKPGANAPEHIHFVPLTPAIKYCDVFAFIVAVVVAVLELNKNPLAKVNDAVGVAVS